MQPGSIFVTNRNDFTHTDRYDGEDYVFPAGERVQLPAEAAAHMLGFGRADKTETLVRLGWANRYDVPTKQWVENLDGVKQLANFIFTQGVLIEVPAEPAPEENDLTPSDLHQLEADDTDDLSEAGLFAERPPKSKAKAKKAVAADDQPPA